MPRKREIKNGWSFTRISNRCRTAKRACEGGGFTLAELAVVLLILGLLASIVLPRYTGIGDSEKLRGSARRIAGLSIEAYSEAATKAATWYLCLDLNENKMWLSLKRPDKQGDDGRESKFYYLPDNVVIVDAEHPALGVIKEGRVSFAYWPQGGSEPGTIHLKNGSDEEMTVFLRPFLGKSDIKQGYLRETEQ